MAARKGCYFCHPQLSKIQGDDISLGGYLVKREISKMQLVLLSVSLIRQTVIQKDFGSARHGNRTP